MKIFFFDLNAESSRRLKSYYLEKTQNLKNQLTTDYVRRNFFVPTKTTNQLAAAFNRKEFEK